MVRDIQQWQTSVFKDGKTPSYEPDGLISRLLATAHGLYFFLLGKLKPVLPTAEFRALEREHDRLQLWADGYAVESGNLDNTLADATRMRHSTVRILVSICRTLANGA